MSRDNKEPIAAASGARTGRGGRFSAPRKAQAMPGLLRGEDLELLSRELGVAASTLSLWREEFLAAGQKGQVCRPRNACRRSTCVQDTSGRNDCADPGIESENTRALSPGEVRLKVVDRRMMKAAIPLWF